MKRVGRGENERVQRTGAESTEWRFSEREKGVERK